MDYETWDVYYRQIRTDFRYSQEDDERSARTLDSVLAGERIDPESLRSLFAGKDATIAGNAPSLEKEIVAVEHPLVAADEATSILRKSGIRPDVIVTDLDGTVEDQIAANAEGAVVVIHAHGDNEAAVKR